MKLLTLAAVVAVAATALLDGFTRARLLRDALLATVALAVVWLLAVIAVSTDWQDADGFIDCNASCSRFQDAISVVLVVAPVAAAGVLAVAVVAGRAARRGRGDASRP